MKDTVGLMLREAWKQKGKPNCSHHQLITEHSFSGTVTGCYICTSCGQLMQMQRREQAGSPQTSRLREGATGDGNPGTMMRISDDEVLCV